jgi:hypothetical protein
MSDQPLEDPIVTYYKNNALEFRKVIEQVADLNRMGKTQEVADLCEDALEREVDPIEY